MLEYTLVTLSQLPNKKRPKLLPNIQIFNLLLKKLQVILTVKKTATNLSDYARSLQEMTKTGKKFIESISRPITKT